MNLVPPPLILPTGQSIDANFHVVNGARRMMLKHLSIIWGDGYITNIDSGYVLNIGSVATIYGHRSPVVSAYQ